MIGIFAAFSFGKIVFEKDSILFTLMFLTLILVSMIIASVYVRSYIWRWIFSSLLFLYMSLLGFLFVKIIDYKLIINDLSKIDDVPKYYIARLSESPSIKEKSVKVIMEIFGYEENNVIKNIDSNIIAYFEKNEKSLRLQYGDCVLIMTNIKEVEKPPNPEQFDYKDYLYKKGIMHQVYLRSDDWFDLDYNKSNAIYEFSYKIRDFLLKTMQRLGIQGEEYAVASAILLGYDDSLPLDLRQKYVAAGAMHILCVSGLHVGVVFMVFSYILVFLSDRKRIQSVIKQLLLLLLVWFYALLAGLAPSILRSTIMISFVILGNIINRKGVLLNSLAASAFILLCFNPSNLFDVGFLDL